MIIRNGCERWACRNDDAEAEIRYNVEGFASERFRVGIEEDSGETLANEVSAIKEELSAIHSQQSLLSFSHSFIA